jgi:predicted acetyltransferase
MLTIREPCLELASSFEAMRDAVLRAGEDAWTGQTALARADVPAFIALLNRRARGQDIPNGWVPEATFWVIESGQVVGELELRHPLNEWLQQVGGNIGYLTHPEHRNQGVATFALREGLRILAGMGVHQALDTCRNDNVASVRVIEKCGGVRIEDSKAIGPARRRYLLSL